MHVWDFRMTFYFFPFPPCFLFRNSCKWIYCNIFWRFDVLCTVQSELSVCSERPSTSVRPLGAAKSSTWHQHHNTWLASEGTCTERPSGYRLHPDWHFSWFPQVPPGTFRHNVPKEVPWALPFKSLPTHHYLWSFGQPFETMHSFLYWALDHFVI
jgi:hypothetical protein